MTKRPRSTQALALALILGGTACAPPMSPAPGTREPGASNPGSTTTPEPTARASRSVRLARSPVETGTPIRLDELSGRILVDDFEDVFAMDVDGTNLVRVAAAPGAEFDAAWSPDGRRVVYRDSTRGINVDDEIYVARADGTERRNLTDDPANDWGPDWSPDGTTIVFSSDRDGAGRLRGWLVDADGANLRRLPVDAWVEYPSFSPDGTEIAFMSAFGGNYEIVVADIATGATRRLTTSPGSDGWPSWSPDGSAIAFTSERDDCAYAPRDADCLSTGDDGEHHGTWLIDPDGANLRRVTPEHGQFVAWSPDGRYLLISGRSLYVVRPDGTGRLELRAEEIPGPLGGIPDWR